MVKANPFLVLASLLIGASVASPVFFPRESVELPTPTKCKNGATYCGGEASKYPLEKIKTIIDQTIELQKSKENMEHFFRPLDQVRLTDPTDVTVLNNDLEPVCKSRKEFLPRFSRAKNVVGKWVYLVEVAKRQEVELTICESVDKPCQNDADSPHGYGTTVCKQLFRTQKLLAVDDSGEVVVDTFELPSACVCNYKSLDLGLRLFDDRDISLEDEKVDPYRELSCGNSSVRHPLNTPFVNFEQDSTEEFGYYRRESSLSALRTLHSGRPARFQRKETELDPMPCDRNNQTFGQLCQAEKYPENDVRSLIRSSTTALKSPVHFKKLFEPPCDFETEVNSFRVGLSPSESPLCDSYQSYEFPKVARNVNGRWRYIINIDEYQQGVTVENCITNREDAPCLYGGAMGNFPEATVCRQRYTRHNLLAITADRRVAYETFLIPSACVCHIKDKSYF